MCVFHPPVTVLIQMESTCRILKMLSSTALLLLAVILQCNIWVFIFSVSQYRTQRQTFLGSRANIPDNKNVLFSICITTGDDCVSIQTGCSGVYIHNVNCGPGHGISIGGLGRDNKCQYTKASFLWGFIFVSYLNKNFKSFGLVISICSYSD